MTKDILKISIIFCGLLLISSCGEKAGAPSAAENDAQQTSTIAEKLTISEQDLNAIMIKNESGISVNSCAESFRHSSLITLPFKFVPAAAKVADDNGANSEAGISVNKEMGDNLVEVGLISERDRLKFDKEAEMSVPEFEKMFNEMGPRYLQYITEHAELQRKYQDICLPVFAKLIKAQN
jgi:hypothetical protein